MVGLSLLVGLMVALSVGFIVQGMRCLQETGETQERMERLFQRPPTIEEVELQRPFLDRVIKPLVRKTARAAGKLLPQQNIENLRHQLITAGRPADLAPLDFLGLRVIAASIMGFLAFVALITRDGSPLRAMIAGAGVAGLGFYLPNFWLHRLISSRQDEIRRALPDALDMLTICVDAGLGFDAALLKIGQKWEHALAREFERVVTETRMGVNRREALRRMAERTDVADVKSFVAVLIQAEELGISIAKVLHAQSGQMRIQRRQLAEQKANQAPIKMLFPLIFLIFPALFAIILGPAIPAVMEAFSTLR